MKTRSLVRVLVPSMAITLMPRALPKSVIATLRLLPSHFGPRPDHNFNPSKSLSTLSNFGMSAANSWLVLIGA